MFGPDLAQAKLLSGELSPAYAPNASTRPMDPLKRHRRGAINLPGSSAPVCARATLDESLGSQPNSASRAASSQSWRAPSQLRAAMNLASGASRNWPAKRAPGRRLAAANFGRTRRPIGSIGWPLGQLAPSNWTAFGGRWRARPAGDNYAHAPLASRRPIERAECRRWPAGLNYFPPTRLPRRSRQATGPVGSAAAGRFRRAAARKWRPIRRHGWPRAVHKVHERHPQASACFRSGPWPAQSKRGTGGTAR